MEAFVAAGAGFLLAVLWFDLMHDVQVRGHDADADLPEPVLTSIAGYYARVTTGARPMTRLIAATMLATLAGIVVELVHGLEPVWLPWGTPRHPARRGRPAEPAGPDHLRRPPGLPRLHHGGADAAARVRRPLTGALRSR